MSSSDIRADLDQWNRITKASNAVVDAYEAFDADGGDVTTFAQASGNWAFIEAADRYLLTADRQLAVLRQEVDMMPVRRFTQLARLDAAAIEAEIRYVLLLREGAAVPDREQWNRAVDMQGELRDTRRALYAEVDAQCAYWRSLP